MTERQREWIRWLILFFFVYLAGFIVQEASRPVFEWASSSALEVLSTFGLTQRFGGYFVYLLRYSMIAAHYLTVGFVYCWLMNVPWRKSGVISWVLFALLQYVPYYWSWYGVNGALMIRVSLTAGWFYADNVMGCAAALVGAWLYHKNRYSQHLSSAKDVLFSVVVFDGR